MQIRFLLATSLISAFLFPLSLTQAPGKAVACHPPTPTAVVSQSTPPVKVTRAEVGIFREKADGTTTFIPTTKIPMQAGSSYGWRLQLANVPAGATVTWKEVFRLPSAPESWTGDPQEFTRTGELEGVTTRTEVVEDNVISNSWTFVDGDPLGQYTMEVYIDGQRVASFQYEVVSTKP